MGKNSKKGFTLVELLITIILLGIIGGIVIYNMSNISTKSKENDYENFIAKVKSAASTYADTYPEAFNELYISKAYLYITTGDIISKGFLDEDLVNPYTNEKIGKDELIKSSLDTTSGAVTFTYPYVNDGLQESTLVAMSDYVVFGEPYDCMRGIGTYELSIADEEGNLINLTDTVNGVSNLEKYNFKCEMPDNFVNDEDVLKGAGSGDAKRACVGECKGKSTTTPGTYEIKYTWVTEDKVKKEATRVLRVLGMAVPTFKMSASDYDFETNGSSSDDKYKNNTNNSLTCSNCDVNNFYQTKLINATTNTWDVLTYSPYIDGADPDTTTFRIRKRTNNPTPGTYVPVTEGFTDNFNFTRQVDDGDKTYEITAKVTGHYYKNYSYQSTGYGRFKAELVIPSEYITSTLSNNVWRTNNTFKIQNDSAGLQSPVGISEYEYKLTSETSVKKSIPAVKDYMFAKNKTAVITQKDLSALSSDGTCPETGVDYTYVYFRAKNNDGYLGTWVRYNAKLTNSVSQIVSTNSSCAASGSQCNFIDKSMFLLVDGKKFNVLSRYGDGTIVVTTDGHSGKLVNPLSVEKGTMSKKVCDCVVYGSYSRNVANRKIADEVERWVKTIEGTAADKLVLPAIDKYTNKYLDKYLKSSIATTYNKSLYSTYKKAAANSTDFWLTDNDTYQVEVTMKKPSDGSHVTKGYVSSAYFYYVTSNGEVKTQYSSQSSYVKPIVRFENLYICSGSGTSGSPYTVI